MLQFDWGIQIQAAVFKTWQATGGKGVKIAVLDTGVDLVHPALKHLNIAGHKLNAAVPGFDPTKPQLHGNGNVVDAYRKRGHGTQCVSVIASKTAGTDALIGIAPEAEVFIVKVNSVDNKFFRVKDFLRGLETAANLGVDFVVVSIAYPIADVALEGITQAEIDRVFGRLKQSGALLLAALPNMDADESWVGIATNSFPSMRPEASEYWRGFAGDT
jgi:subtilisin family serine protease